VHVDKVTHAREHRGDYKRLAVRRESHVADKCFIEDFVNGLAVINGAIRFARHTRSLRRSEILWHKHLIGEAWRRPFRGRSFDLIAAATAA
jgi:hypothetical protein